MFFHYLFNTRTFRHLLLNIFATIHAFFAQYIVRLNIILGNFCSQPPLLSAMVCEIYKRSEDLELARKSLPALVKEYQFWNSGIWLVRHFFFFFFPLVATHTHIYPKHLFFHPLQLVLIFTVLHVLLLGIHGVTIQDAETCDHTLSRYYAMWNKPRPESSTIVCFLQLNKPKIFCNF